MCRFIDNFMDIQSNAVTTDESIVLKLAEDVYFLVLNRLLINACYNFLKIAFGILYQLLRTIS